MALQPGQQLGHYRLGGLLGSGGMAEVWSATHAVLEVRVAIKVLFSSAPAQQAQLLREGRVQAAMDHPNVVPVRDVVDVNGALGLVLPLIEGPDLGALLSRYVPTESEAVALFLPILDGVGHAHQQGLVHRDLKPANILLHTRSGRIVPRIADFGLVHRGGGSPGVVAGTLGYAAPEQLRAGASIDHRADLYALGAILYRLLSGSRPFGTGSLAGYREAQVQGPDLSRLPQRWAPLVSKLLQHRPDARPAGCAEVHRMVDEVAGPLGDELSVGHPLAAAVCGGGSAPGEHTATLSGTLDRVVPVPVPVRAVTDNLPAQRDGFFGRDAERARLVALLSGEGRLVSVLGMGGVGKTRFVINFCWEHRAEYPDGVSLCDLSEARTVEDIAAAVARGLEVTLGRGDPIAQLGDAIAGRGRALVVLDNFEQVTGFAEQTVGRWLDRLGSAQLVVTSREVLGLPGEQQLHLPPLDQDSAAALFTQRMQAVRPGVLSEAGAQAAIAELVALLDCLPLAIELAAARGRILSPQQLLARMDQRFRLLSAGGRRPGRQSTLRATLDWSWHLLSGWEQEALAQLSVFEGGFSLESAEAVLLLGDASIWPLDAVQALVDRSLVRVVGDGRFGLLMSVQAYAAEQLGAPEAAAVQQRHSACFARHGAAAAIEALSAHGGGALLRALSREVDNLAAASRRALAAGDGHAAASAALAAWEVLKMNGPLSLGIAMLEATLPQSGDEEVRVRLALGRAQLSSGAIPEASAHLEQALSQAIARGDRLSEGRAQAALGLLRTMQGQLAQAAAHYTDALQLLQDPGHAIEPDRRRRTIGNVLANLGIVRHQQGEMSEARVNYEEALSIHRAVGNRPSEGRVQANLGLLCYQQGQLAQAKQHYQRSRELQRAIGNRGAEGKLVSNLGNLALQEGRIAEACDHFEAALRIQRRKGDRRTEGRTLGNLGQVYLKQGRAGEAQAAFEQALSIHRAVGNRPSEGLMLGSLGMIARHRGQHGEAAALLEQALSIHRAVGNRSAEGQTLSQLGLLCTAQGHPEEAREHHRQAIVLHRAVRDPLSEATSLADLGTLSGDPAAGRALLAEAEALVRSHADPLLLALTLCRRADLEQQAGDEAAAFLREAEQLAAGLELGPDAELSRRLRLLRSAMD